MSRTEVDEVVGAATPELVKIWSGPLVPAYAVVVWQVDPASVRAMLQLKPSWAVSRILDSSSGQLIMQRLLLRGAR